MTDHFREEPVYSELEPIDRDVKSDSDSEPFNPVSMNEMLPVAGSADDLFATGRNKVNIPRTIPADRSKENDDTPEGTMRPPVPKEGLKIRDQKSSPDLAGNSASRLSNN